MDQKNPTEEKVEETGIVVESVEDDMRNLGIDVPESKPDEEAEGTAAIPEAKEEGEKPKKKSRAQRKIERQAREIKELKEQRDQESNPKKDKEEIEVKGVIDVAEINVDDFENYDSYKEALDKAEEVAKSKAEATKPEGKKSEELNTRISDMREDGIEDYDNFEEVLTNPDFPLTETVLEAITQSDVSADLAYYLGTHLDKAQEIAQMDEKGLAKALMRIEIELENKPAKAVRTTKAPEPIKPVGGGNSSEQKTLNDDDLSYEEHEALLNSRQQASAGGFL